MNVHLSQTQDVYVQQLVDDICATIRAKFPQTTFEVCAHPTHRGAIIDAHVPTN